MSGKLRDTNAVVALQREDEALLKFLSADFEILVPAVVLGELYYGAFLTLVTCDEHFKQVDRLLLEAW